MKIPSKLILWVTFPGLLAMADLVDPTQPPCQYDKRGCVTTSQSVLTLTAIIIRPNERLAIINGQVAKEGDHIKQFTLKAITPYTVELVDDKNAKKILALSLTVKNT